jgi:large subunit ribosomal protein L22
MEAIAKVKLQRVSSSKAALVANMIRGKHASVALSILNNTNKKAAPILSKLLSSAMANGVNNHAMNADKMIVSEVQINEGPTLKRFRPISKGRANRILKRTCNMTIKLQEVK